MTLIGFVMAAAYLAWFYFFIDYGIEKEALFLPLFLRGVASVVISIVFLTSIVQSGLSFQIFPQALSINGFTGAVMGATLGPALIGEWFQHTVARNASIMSGSLTPVDPAATSIPMDLLWGMVQRQSLVVSMKEIYGWLLIVALGVILIIAISYGPARPWAIFPKWSSLRRAMRRMVRAEINAT